MATIYTFRTKRFTLRFEALEEYDLDLSWDTTGETAEALNSGRFVAFCAKVSIELDGNEIASDYLGQCIYETPEMFMDHRAIAAMSRKDGRNYGSYFSDMVRTVVAEARDYIGNVPEMRAS